MNKRSLYEVRRELIKYYDNLREINRLMVSEPSETLVNNKKKIKNKINELEEEYKKIKENNNTQKYKKLFE
jgi:uncharacterized membrane protein (DUF106 family)|uniref:Uncharacterized protein n=1 Tax=Myoviridae sp. ct96L1 TaxID=2826623 RepID=A0A8S5N3C1_9CAUD|nr:MAG TPA: hypothetical protein [Myoviridae sp. ct96L1]